MNQRNVFNLFISYNFKKSFDETIQFVNNIVIYIYNDYNIMQQI